MANPTLKQGSRGEDVKRWQRIIGVSPVDGIFGTGTATATKNWQKARGLVADGIVGLKTWDKSAEVSPVPANIPSPSPPFISIPQYAQQVAIPAIQAAAQAASQAIPAQPVVQPRPVSIPTPPVYSTPVYTPQAPSAITQVSPAQTARPAVVQSSVPQSSSVPTGSITIPAGGGNISVAMGPAQVEKPWLQDPKHRQYLLFAGIGLLAFGGVYLATRKSSRPRYDSYQRDYRREERDERKEEKKPERNYSV